MTAPDYFLWGYLKHRVYGNHPSTIAQLKQNICTEIALITDYMCGNVMQNAIKRAKICQASRGGHMNGQNLNFCNVYVYIKV